MEDRRMIHSFLDELYTHIVLQYEIERDRKEVRAREEWKGKRSELMLSFYYVQFTIYKQWMSCNEQTTTFSHICGENGKSVTRKKVFFGIAQLSSERKKKRWKITATQHILKPKCSACKQNEKSQNIQLFYFCIVSDKIRENNFPESDSYGLAVRVGVNNSTENELSFISYCSMTQQIAVESYVVLSDFAIHKHIEVDNHSIDAASNVEMSWSIWLECGICWLVGLVVAFSVE